MGISVFPEASISTGWELVASTTISGNPASVDFTGINAKYNSLKIVTSSITKTGNSRTSLRLNNNATNSYSFGIRTLTTTTWNTLGNPNTNQIHFFTSADSVSENLTILIEQANNTGYKSVTAYANRDNLIVESFGTFQTTFALTEVNLLSPGAVFGNGGIIYLYGKV